jgi:hypothetical protein
MAVDTINRWQLVREVITQKRSGAIVLQTGRNYLHWILERGNLVCVSSTLPEASFASAIQERKHGGSKQNARSCPTSKTNTESAIIAKPGMAALDFLHRLPVRAIDASLLVHELLSNQTGTHAL